MDNKTIVILFSIIVPIIMYTMINYIRLKNSSKPVETRKLILPPLFMATGASMYIVPMFRPTGIEIIFAIISGMLFSILLIKTSKFEVRGGQIYLQRSKLFIVVLLGLIAVRFIAKLVLTDTFDIEPAQMSGAFFLLAFSMILPWRVGMYLNYRKIRAELDARESAVG